MSAKWIRVKRWDDRHLTGPLRPLWYLLRAFSSITLAIALLSLVALYGILASVPVGILAMAPTWVVYGLSLLAAIAAGAFLPVALLWRGLRRVGYQRAVRVAWSVPIAVGLTVLTVLAWGRWAWPVLRHDPQSGSGVMFFAEFTREYSAVQVRRLPGFEMSELEFYAWWPLSLVLVLFVINMATATVRRIEFRFMNLGVLTVHAGIITLALGSAVYSSLKREGDMLLLAGTADAAGAPRPGPPDDTFHDNTDTVLWAAVDPAESTGGPGTGWQPWRFREGGGIAGGLPRYNDYHLGAVPGTPPSEDGVRGPHDHGPINVHPLPPPGGPAPLASDVRLRVIGYASYADLRSEWAPMESVPDGAAARAFRRARVRVDVAAAARVLGASPQPGEPAEITLDFLPEIPAERARLVDLLDVEYTRGVDERRWTDLGIELPAGARRALVVEHPESGFRGVFPADRAGGELAVGATGYTIALREVFDEPPFPIITPGYERAPSGLALVRVTPPGGSAFTRWVYERFPEISQDLVDPPPPAASSGTSGPPTAPVQPMRRAADSALKITYLDASRLRVNIDERPDGTLRAVVRMPGGKPVLTDVLRVGDPLPIAPALTFTVERAWPHAERIERPMPTPADMRNAELVGNHKKAAIAVEVGTARSPGWRRVLWLPFTQYLKLADDTVRFVALPDGRRLTLAFGRVLHELPMALRLADFEMIPYPHSDTPRDFRSEVIVQSRWGGVHKDEPRVTSLNEPLLVTVPFAAREDLPWFANAAARLVSLAVPRQYKFSQAGWDAEGWRQTRTAAESGQGTGPSARFTILGVGNNPGIYIIACGAVMMSVGIPWAFYIKPLLLRRERNRLAAQARTAARPAREGTPAPRPAELEGATGL